MDSQEIATIEGKINSLLRDNSCLKNGIEHKDEIIRQLKALVADLEKQLATKSVGRIS